MKLRKLLIKDAPLMLEWMKDKDITKNFRNSFETMTQDDVINFIKSTDDCSINAHYAIVDDFDEYLGTISLKNINEITKDAEYAICLRKKAIGTSIALDSTNELIKIAFKELHLNKVYLNVFLDNIRANKFYLKAGFIFERCEKNAFELNGVSKDLNWYIINK